jgi:hypothetical protein
MGSNEAAEQFFDKYWPDALSIQDPKQVLYKGLGVTWGSFAQFVSPKVWKAYFSAREFGVGKPVGNTMRNPGAYLIADNKIVHSQDFEHFGVLLDIDGFRSTALVLES